MGWLEPVANTPNGPKNLRSTPIADVKRGFRDRRKHTLFIDARKLGTLIDRVHRELTDADLAKIVSTYNAWRGDEGINAKPQSHEGAKKKKKNDSKENLCDSASLRLF